jgi:hypothetical protein
MSGPTGRRRSLRQMLAARERWICYIVLPHPRNGSLMGPAYYGDEHWKIRYWRKAITG